MDKKDRFWFWAFVVFATIATVISIYRIWAVPAPATSEQEYLVVLAKDMISGKPYRIVYDPNTGVEYYWGEGYLTPLYNADGTLKIYSP